MKTRRVLTEKDSSYFFNSSIHTMLDAIGWGYIDKKTEKIQFDFNAVLLLRFHNILSSSSYILDHKSFDKAFQQVLQTVLSTEIHEKSDINYIREMNHETYHFIIKVEENVETISLLFICQEKLLESEKQFDEFSTVIGSGLSLFKGCVWWIDYDYHEGQFFMSDTGPSILGVPLSSNKIYSTSEFQKVRERASIVSAMYEEAVKYEKEAYEQVRQNKTDYFAGRTPTVTHEDEILWVEAYGKCLLRYPDGRPRFFVAVDIYMTEIFEEKTQLKLLTNLIDQGLINSNVGVWYHQRQYKEGIYYFTDSYHKLMSTEKIYKDETITGLLNKQIELMKQDGRGYEKYLDHFREIHNSIYTTNRNKYDVIIPNYKDDTTFQWIEIRGTVIERDDEGHVLLFVGVNVDVTETYLRNQELERLRIQNERLQLAETLAIRARNLMMWYYDRDSHSSNTIFGNDVFEDKLGLERDEEGNILITDLLSTLVIEKTKSAKRDLILYLFRNLDQERVPTIKNIVTKHRNLKTNKEIYIEHSVEMGEKLTDSDNYLIGGVMMDVTDTIVRQKRIKYLAEFDALSGVHNRNYFENYISNKLPASYTILIFDLDGLKLINDAFGHIEGDRIIITLASYLLEAFGDNLFISRIGGDEFAVLLGTDNYDIVTKKVDAFEELIEEFNKESKIEMNVSKGGKRVTNNEIEFDKAFVEAENIMYRRKLNNRKSRKSKVLHSILETLNAKTEETKDHSERLREHAVKTMKKLGYTRSSEIEDIELLARVHDIGKITIEDRILKKPSKLTASEFELVKKHCEAGYKVIRNITDSDNVCNGVLFHHERWDGNGYPQGLKGEEIPIFARIINVVDAYDAMTHDRVYSKKITQGEAIKELIRCKGTQFDPVVVDAFLESCFTNKT